MAIRRIRRGLGLILCALLLMSVSAVAAQAADQETYVLMNIPYGEFYAAELNAEASPVDAVTSATRNKPRTGTLAGGSYHQNADGSDISGVIYPVLVKDTALLEGLNRVDDSARVEITVVNRGKESTVVYEGADALFEAPSYSYYILSEKPACYKELQLENGGFVFSAVKGEAGTVSGVTANLTLGGRHTDVEIVLENTAGIDIDSVVSGVVVTASDGSCYGLRHVCNIWRGTQLGWNLDEAVAGLGGKTITNIRYITRDAVVDYPVELAVGDSGYVLMNIPYADFYAAELGEEDAPDAVSAATANKRSNGNLAAGSYHVGAEGAGVDGVIYPVFMPEMGMLDAGKEITDGRSVEITTSARGKTSTTVYEGKDSLFEAEDYSWYRLTERPARSKVLSAAEDGSWRFSAVGGRAVAVEGVTASVTYNGRHTTVEIVLEGTEGIAMGDRVNAVVLTTDDEARYGLGHVTNIWRGTELGWNLDEPLAAINGKTITNIRYYTESAVIDYPVSISIADLGSTGFVDIPEDADYAAAVIWARKDRITNGTGNGIFSPDLAVDRATLFAFLWKRAGQPRPTGETSPFSDVAEDAWYRNAALWAAENGIIDGADSFGPREQASMAEIIGLLWKASGSPEAAEQSFPGVPAGAWYAPALAWAAEKGLIRSGDFVPEAPCTRAEIVSLLYRAAN